MHTCSSVHTCSSFTSQKIQERNSCQLFIGENDNFPQFNLSGFLWVLSLFVLQKCICCIELSQNWKVCRCWGRFPPPAALWKTPPLCGRGPPRLSETLKEKQFLIRGPPQRSVWQQLGWTSRFWWWSFRLQQTLVLRDGCEKQTRKHGSSVRRIDLSHRSEGGSSYKRSRAEALLDHS